MKTLSLLVSTLSALVLTACGGGGSPSQSASSTAPPVASTTPTVSQTAASTTVINPITGAADGPQVSTVHTSAPIGATVDLYAVMPDGTSGAALGPTQTATKGTVTFTVATPISGMVRFVSKGGDPLVRASDNRFMPFGTLELVAPFVSNTENYFQVTQATHIASRVLTAKAKAGATLVEAYKAGVNAVLSLDLGNLGVTGADVSNYWLFPTGITNKAVSNGTETVPALLRGIEAFGAFMDMPAIDTLRIITEAAEANFSTELKNINGTPIIAGAWVNGIFNPAAPVTFATLFNARTPDTEKVVDPITKLRGPGPVNTFISQYLILSADVHQACFSGDYLYFHSRHPYFPLDSQGHVTAAACADADQKLAQLAAQVKTNQTTLNIPAPVYKR